MVLMILVCNLDIIRRELVDLIGMAAMAMHMALAPASWERNVSTAYIASYSWTLLGLPPTPYKHKQADPIQRNRFNQEVHYV
eukprot:1838545-Amphidinium_carterae.1